MLEHLVLIKVNDENMIDQASQAIVALKEKIPEIVEISAGRNFASRSQGFQLGLRVKFASKQDLETYQVHPAHVELIEEVITPIKEDVIAMDYEY